LLTQDFRDAVQRGDDAEQRSAFRSLIGRLSPEVSFRIACEKLVMFLPKFEACVPGVDWVRRFLEEAVNCFGGAGAVAQPADFEFEEERYSFAGAGNYIDGLEELWLAMRDRSNREQFEQWVVRVFYSCLVAELEHLWAKSHPEDWARSSQVIGGHIVDGKLKSLSGQDLLVLTNEFLNKREDEQLRDRRVQFWTDIADRIDQIASV
jgi:hypothetical protein